MAPGVNSRLCLTSEREGGWVRLAVEETGEVFRYKVWAESSRELRKLLAVRMQARLRVMRPVFRGHGPDLRSIYPVRACVCGHVCVCVCMVVC